MILPSIGRRHAPQMADSRLSKQRRQYRSPSRSRHLCVNCLLYKTIQNTLTTLQYPSCDLPTLTAEDVLPDYDR